MPARIAELDEGQRGRMATWARGGITRGLATGPVDRAAVEEAIGACYRLAGQRWPGLMPVLGHPHLPLAAPALRVPAPAVGMSISPRPATRLWAAPPSFSAARAVIDPVGQGPEVELAHRRAAPGGG